MSSEKNNLFYDDELIEDSPNNKKMESLRVIKSKYAENESKGVCYTKFKKLSFPVKKLSFKNIPVLKGVKLSFYEKYTVLLLQKGIKAVNSKELVNKISNILNVNKRCIEEFVDYLMFNNSIFFDTQKMIFKLDSSIHYCLNPALNNAMFADVEVKQADCNDVVFVEGVTGFFLTDDFPKTTYTPKGNTQEKNLPLPYSVQSIILSKKSVLKPLIERSLLSKNLHLTKTFSFELQSDRYAEYNIEFDAILEYKFNEAEGKAVRQKTTVQADNLLSDDYVNELASEFDFDVALPKFIMHNDFYEDVMPKLTEMHSIKGEMAEIEVAPLKQELNVEVANLNRVKKEHEKKLKYESERASDIQKELEQAEKAIEENNDKVIKSANKDADEIEALKRVIADLTDSKKELLKQLKKQEATISEITQAHSAEEEKLNNSIKQKQVELEDKTKRLHAFETEYSMLAKEHKKLVNKNKSLLNPVIQEVIEKYPAETNIMNGSINEVCVYLDRAISASECDSFNEVANSLDKIRESYKKLLKALFDVTLKNKADNLGVYLNDPFCIIDVENMFRVSNVPLATRRTLQELHKVENAFAHIIDDGPKKQDNLAVVQQFVEKSKEERENILLSIPVLFKNIKLNDKNIKKISDSLSIEQKLSKTQRNV